MCTEYYSYSVPCRFRDTSNTLNLLLRPWHSALLSNMWILLVYLCIVWKVFVRAPAMCTAVAILLVLCLAIKCATKSRRVEYTMKDSLSSLRLGNFQNLFRSGSSFLIHFCYTMDLLNWKLNSKNQKSYLFLYKAWFPIFLINVCLQNLQVYLKSYKIFLIKVFRILASSFTFLFLYFQHRSLFVLLLSYVVLDTLTMYLGMTTTC